MAQGRQRTQNFIRFLTSYGLVATQDMADEMRFYDAQDKTQRNPQNRAGQRVGDSVDTIQGIPQRIIDIGAFQ